MCLEDASDARHAEARPRFRDPFRSAFHWQDQEQHDRHTEETTCGKVDRRQHRDWCLDGVWGDQ